MLVGKRSVDVLPARFFLRYYNVPSTPFAPPQQMGPATAPQNLAMMRPLTGVQAMAVPGTAPMGMGGGQNRPMTGMAAPSGMEGGMYARDIHTPGAPPMMAPPGTAGMKMPGIAETSPRLERRPSTSMPGSRQDKDQAIKEATATEGLEMVDLQTKAAMARAKRNAEVFYLKLFGTSTI